MKNGTRLFIWVLVLFVIYLSINAGEVLAVNCATTCLPVGPGVTQMDRDMCIDMCERSNADPAFSGCQPGYEGGPGGLCFPANSTLNGVDDAGSLLSRVISWLLYIIGLISVLFIVVSGIQYITSAGDEKKADAAKENLKTAIIGLVIALSAYVIVFTVIKVIEGS